VLKEPGREKVEVYKLLKRRKNRGPEKKRVRKGFLQGGHKNQEVIERAGEESGKKGARERNAAPRGGKQIKFL